MVGNKNIGNKMLLVEREIQNRRGWGMMSADASTVKGGERELSDAEKKEIKRVFYAFASVGLPEGQKGMNMNDFLRSLSTSLDHNGKIVQTVELSTPKKFALLFRMADRDGNGNLTYAEYEALHQFVLSSENEYQVAFKLFDRSSDGALSFEEFVSMMETMDPAPLVAFDWQSTWLDLYFGRERQQQLSYPAFTQMLKSLSAERARQEFTHYDTEGRGLISTGAFLLIGKRVAKGKLPDHFIQRLPELGNLDQHHKGLVSFAQFQAFLSFIVHFPSYFRVAKHAREINSSRRISKAQFLSAAQPPATSIDISPLEVGLLFLWFGDDGGELSPEALEPIAEEIRMLKHPNAHIKATQSDTFFEQLLDAAANFGLGGIAGGMGASAVYPIDLVKTRMQAQVSAKGSVLLYQNSWDCFRKVVTREGPRALYRGLGPQLVGVAPEKAIKLTVNDYLRRLFGRAAPNPDGKMYLPLEILAGGGAGASQVVFTNPLEIVKIRLQMQGEGGVAQRGATAIVQDLGFVGLYKGASACFLRDIPFSMIYFPTYAALKEYFASKNPDGKASPTQVLLAGTIAGAPSAGLCTPADVIKTRLQIEARAGTSSYTGIRDCFWKVLEKEGSRAFWKGAAARMFRSSPQFGVTLLTYEQLQKYFFPNVAIRPPTNVPINPEDLIQTHIFRAVERVETKWGFASN